MTPEPTPARSTTEKAAPGGGGRLSNASFGAEGDFDPDGPVRGYYVNFRAKAPEPQWPPDWLRPRPRQMHVATAQWGLGAHERYLAGEGDAWLDAARACAEHLVALQRTDGGLEHQFSYPHTYAIAPPWLSAMAQGEAASLLVRVHLATGDARFAEAARQALRPTESPQSGVLSELDGRPFLEEYPTDPPSHVLNGGIFAIWGVYDVGRGLADDATAQRFTELADAVADLVDRYDIGYWSSYDLYPHPVPNVASSAYHALHIVQLRALHRLHPRPELAAAADRFEAYARRAGCRRRALAQKVAFRLAVPRNRYLAHRLPWS